MKIEMGESLGSSWLKHIKKCQIVQTNWKVSQNWKHMHDENELKTFLDELKNKFENDGFDIFKKNSSFQQIIRQTECDIVGCSFCPEPSFYSLEVAYHGNQLNYGSEKVTIAKVVAKLLKAALALYCYFGITKAEIGFASPKISFIIEKKLQIEITKLQKLFTEQDFHFNFKLYANKSFKTEIMDPILKLANDIADTGELFLRSFQLYKLTTDNRQQKENESVECQENKKELPKVSQIVKEKLIPILQRENFSQDEIDHLMDVDFSRNIFRLSFPLLALNIIDTKRYYKKTVTLHGKKYYLCNDWYEKNRNALLSWIEQHKED